MKTRDEVQTFLEDVLGNSNVYFQSPPNTGMHYPCIVYRFRNFDRRNADNKPYLLTGRWEIHHMYKSIKNDIKEKMLNAAPYIDFDNRIVKDGIYNDYYTIFQ